MLHRILSVCASLLLVFPLQGCKLFDMGDDENATGRGAKNFDPYQGGISGAQRLSLMMYNGCAILPNTEVVGRGDAAIPYPDCKLRGDQRNYYYVADPAVPAPTQPIQILTNSNYFLNQLTLINSVVNQHTDVTRLSEVAAWMRNVAPFNKLDWAGFSETSDEMLPSSGYASPYAWQRRVSFGNAAWQLAQDDTFKVELLDAEGSPVSEVTYDRDELLVSNPATAHTVLQWTADNIQPPRFPGDTELRQAPPPPPGFPPPGNGIKYRTLLKLEVMTSTNPRKSLEVPDGLQGDGAIRVTWSQLPDDPFYFPVQFERADDIPLTCYDANDPSKRVACNFGLIPDAVFAPPTNGSFYVPGETIQITLQVKDSSGNLLHPPDQFPSWNEYVRGQANGILYSNTISLVELQDQDTLTGYLITGPRQSLVPSYELNDTTFFRSPTQQQYIPGVGNDGLRRPVAIVHAINVFPGLRDAHPATTQEIKLPEDAKPGTYTLYWKVHRYFLGERMTKMEAIQFQVGQDEETTYPGRVGNCQLCHRGALSLENVRHGLSVDHIEGCKSCHSRDFFTSARGHVQSFFHRAHMNSTRYPKPKRDCTVCHLSKESTTRPSYLACSSCHPAPHGGEYSELNITTDFDPTLANTIYGNCAQACHTGVNAPTQHILPPQ